MRTRALTPVSEGRFRGVNERIIGNNGEINASDKQDLMQKLVDIASAIQNNELAVAEVSSVSKAERAAAVREAFDDRNSSAWAEMGAALAFEIDNRVEREGLLRTVLARGELQDGSIPRIRVRERNVHAVVSRGVAQVYPQYLRDKYLMMDEFYVSALPRIEEIELRQGSGDQLEEKYYEGLEAILVREDQTLLKLLRTADGIYNDVIYFNGSFTQTVFQAAKKNVERWRIPATTAIAGMDLLSDLTVGTDFSTWFDPISKWEIVQTGRIGRILGMEIITDGYREPGLQVLGSNEFFITGSPEFLGGYTDRGPVESRAVDEYDKLVPARGWSMFEILAMSVANAKAVSRAIRV